jgi:hypothetical protein
MNFAPLSPGSRVQGVAFGYTIRKGHNHNGLSLQLILSPETIRKAGLSPDQTVRLDADTKEGLARLTVVGSIAKLARPLRIAETGRGMVRMACKGAVAEVFGHEACGVQPLTVVEFSTDGLIFELPKKEDAQ